MGIESLCLPTSLILVFRGINQGEVIEFSSHYSLLFSFFNDFLTSYRYFSIVSSWSKALLNKYLVCVFGYCRTQQVQQDSDGLNWKRHLSSKSRWSWGSSMICCWTWRSIREKRKTAVSSSSSGGESTRLFQPEGLSTWHRIVCFARRLVECEPASEAWKWYRQQGRIGTDGSWSVMKLSVLFFGGFQLDCTPSIMNTPSFSFFIVSLLLFRLLALPKCSVSVPIFSTVTVDDDDDDLCTSLFISILYLCGRDALSDVDERMSNNRREKHQADPWNPSSPIRRMDLSHYHFSSFYFSSLFG